jgi:hypothetical protein
MTSFRDWVVETSSTTGTGAYALSGSPPAGTSYFTFRQRYSNGDDEVCYWVVSADRTKWEKNRFGTLTYGTPDTLSRNVVESTNGDAPISWVGGDGPLRIYVVPDADAEEFAITMGLGATRPGVLKYGAWSDLGGLATNYDLLNLYDGTSDDPIGFVNKIAHRATIYGLPPGYLYGLTLSRSSATVLGIAAGIAIDSTNVIGIKLASAFTKSVAGAWAVGTGNNGMGNALTIANNTWYHVFVILNAGLADVYFDTSVTAANKPTNTTHFRRIGSFKTNGSAQIIDFTQTGDLFQWAAATEDWSAQVLTNNSTTTQAMNVPTGVAVMWQGHAWIASSTTGATYGADIRTPGQTRPSNGYLLAGFVDTAGGGGGKQDGTFASILTDTSAQVTIFAVGTGGITFTASTYGWIDRRGRDA